VKFKLDENIGLSGKAILSGAGHDVATVASQNLQGIDDESLFEICASEARILVTLDRDFGRLVRFPSTQSAGVVILETGSKITVDAINARLREFLMLCKAHSPLGRLWIVEPGRVRMHLSE
jgi:predicted nuclease of predicted toxin-antitoxin system